MRRCAAPSRLSAQAPRLPGRGSTRAFFAPEFLLCRVPHASDFAVGALPWSAGVLRAGGGAGVGSARRADTSGGRAVGRGARRDAPHHRALARLVVRAVPADTTVARDLRALHAAPDDRAAPGEPDRALRRHDAGGLHAPAGLHQSRRDRRRHSRCLIELDEGRPTPAEDAHGRSPRGFIALTPVESHRRCGPPGDFSEHDCRPPWPRSMGARCASRSLAP